MLHFLFFNSLTIAIKSIIVASGLAIELSYLPCNSVKGSVVALGSFCSKTDVMSAKCLLNASAISSDLVKILYSRIGLAVLVMRAFAPS